MLGSAVGGLIVLTNTRTLLHSDWIGDQVISGGVMWAVYALIWAVWVGAVAYSVREHRAQQHLVPAAARTSVSALAGTAD